LAAQTKRGPEGLRNEGKVDADTFDERTRDQQIDCAFCQVISQEFL